jgi:hypothetical protein
MLRISKQSRLSTDEIIAKASGYFGKGGEGLDETERGGCCISFSGAGGYVTVTVSEQTNQREVGVKPESLSTRPSSFLGLFEVSAL